MKSNSRFFEMCCSRALSLALSTKGSYAENAHRGPEKRTHVQFGNNHLHFVLVPMLSQPPSLHQLGEGVKPSSPVRQEYPANDSTGECQLLLGFTFYTHRISIKYPHILEKETKTHSVRPVVQLPEYRVP
jgi:hypothetical protein